MYESFVRYQRWLLGEFDKMVETYGFEIVDASGTIEEVFPRLRDRIEGSSNATDMRMIHHALAHRACRSYPARL